MEQEQNKNTHLLIPDFLDAMKQFEKRNNISIIVEFCSDGSCHFEEFWNDEILKECETPKEAFEFLKNIQYELDENGLCYSPIRLCDRAMSFGMALKAQEQKPIDNNLIFAKWLEENTEVIKTDKITLYRYCDRNNEWGNYILDDIYLEYLDYGALKDLLK